MAQIIHDEYIEVFAFEATGLLQAVLETAEVYRNNRIHCNQYQYLDMSWDELTYKFENGVHKFIIPATPKE